MKAFAAVLISVATLTGCRSEFIPRCGDCWCINDPVNMGVECPAFGPGIADEYPAEIIESYKSFTLVSNPILLQTEAGSPDCYPFADTVDPIDRYPKSNDPQCAIPETSENAVCAFKFASQVGSNEECCGREYELVTYDTEQEALDDGAQVTHFGSCGICSNAHDWAVRMKNPTTIDEHLTLCATSYSLSTEEDRFETLVKCHMEVSNRVSLGFTEECALLWAHYGATNSGICAEECAAGFLGDVGFNSAPPECTLNDCLTCSSINFQEAFDKLSGRVMTKSGLTEVIARNCTDFVPVIHEPCGNFTCSTLSTPSPTPSSGGEAPATQQVLYSLTTTLVMVMISMRV